MKTNHFGDEYVFYHFFELVKNLRKRRQGVLFTPYLDSLKMKISLSTSLFELVKVNEQTFIQYKFTLFMD